MVPGFTSPASFVLDTGSTGITVSSDIWNAKLNGAANLGSGSITYTSSGRQLIGDWYQATLKLGDGPTTAESSVPVLQVTSITCLTVHRDCQDNDHPLGVSFFGIGFGREATSQSTTPGGTVAAIPANNPLLNITKVNGVAVTASTPQQPGASGVVGDYTSGYILSPAGLTLGLTAANTAPFPTLDLTWNDRTSASGFNSGYADWNPVPGTLTVNGSSGTGTVLTDSGVDYMLLTPRPWHRGEHGWVLQGGQGLPGSRHQCDGGDRHARVLRLQHRPPRRRPAAAGAAGGAALRSEGQRQRGVCEHERELLR